MPNSNNSFKKKAVRSLFLTFDKEEKTKVDIDNEILASGMKYIQMKLPVEKITPEFEAEISSKIEHGVIRADIRETSSKDLELVVYLYNRSWMTSSTPYSPITIETLKKIASYQETTILIARVYGTDGGFVILDLEGPNKEYGIIAGLGVIPRFQRKGLGKILGMAAWNHFKKIGVKELRCEVYYENKASFNFISSLGFEEFDVKIYRSEDFNPE
ncbi:MAG: GNAT family N-acetyltransferase [Promethearchaeota archaeon]